MQQQIVISNLESRRRMLGIALIACVMVAVVALFSGVIGLTAAKPIHTTGHEPDHFAALLPSFAGQVDSLPACGSVEEVRLLQTAIPVTAAPPTAVAADAPTATAPPPTATPRPAPIEDRVLFPEGYQENFKLLFVFDRPDNRQVRVICGNDTAAAREAGEPFAYGSILVMETYRAKLDADGQPELDADGHYIRQTLTGVFVQRKEEGFGEAYLEDRSGEWEYTAYRPDGSVLIPPMNTNNCASCHLRQAGESVDFTFRMDMFHLGDAAFVPAPMGENSVNIFIYEFMPTTLMVKAGTTVTWINNDESEHTIVSDDGLFESDNLKTVKIKPGDSFSFTFDTPGTYKYICSIHPHMTATIEVSQ